MMKKLLLLGFLLALLTLLCVGFASAQCPIAGAGDKCEPALNEDVRSTPFVNYYNNVCYYGTFPGPDLQTSVCRGYLPAGPWGFTDKDCAINGPTGCIVLCQECAYDGTNCKTLHPKNSARIDCPTGCDCPQPGFTPIPPGNEKSFKNRAVQSYYATETAKLGPAGEKAKGKPFNDNTGAAISDLSTESTWLGLICLTLIIALVIVSVTAFSKLSKAK